MRHRGSAHLRMQLLPGLPHAFDRRADQRRGGIHQPLNGPYHLRELSRDLGDQCTDLTPQRLSAGRCPATGCDVPRRTQ